MIKKAVLPVAGIGTRFLPASKATPKEMLPIIDKLEKKLGILVFSSNQTLIWDTLKNIGVKNKLNGFGKLFRSL